MSKLKQLSGLDASFIYLDTDRASTGGTMIYVYDQSTIPGGGHLRFKEILKHIESRTATSPIFRQKLKQVPMSLDYPYWVEDENFRIENHVFHVALPKPGDWRQFCIMASRLTTPPISISIALCGRCTWLRGWTISTGCPRAASPSSPACITRP